MGGVKWAWVLMSGTLWACGGRYGDGSDTGSGSSSGAASGGSGGASSATGSTSTTSGSTTSTGAGGSGSPPTHCVMTAMKVCSGSIGCHGKALPVANLNLTFESLMTNYKALYYNKPNEGVGDPMYCQPGTGKLVDSANPLQSLIYAKLLTQQERDAGMMPPCGEAMPPAGQRPVTDADKACVLQWIRDVIAGSEAQR